MSYRTIVLLLFFIFLQVDSFSQVDSVNIPRDSALFELLRKDQLQCKVDSLIDNAVNAEAFPGCVIHATYRGETLFSKAYGFHTYDSLRPVEVTNLYDLASVSKPTGAVLALMKLYELKLINLDDPLKEYIDGFGWNKRGKAVLRDLLTHQSGFQGWIKFYEKIKKNNGKYRWHTISDEQSADYPFMIAKGMYLHKDFYQKIKGHIKRADFQKEPGYVYSDLFFYLVPEIVRNTSGMEYTEFLAYYFYDSLGVQSLGFNPLEHYDATEIVPTEIDTFFRMENLHGKVHDEGAILMNGVSGHAGLFSNAVDLSKIWQMLLNNGIYNNRRYLEASTVDLFTSYQFPANDNRRALGFDKPLLVYDPVISSIAAEASIYSFGHTGFTGPLVWADPKYELLFIFLTNRVYPDRNHKAIYELNVRPTLHQTFYHYLLDREEDSQKN